MYRPQFPYPTPEGCRDEEFVYFFDGDNTPLLNQSVAGQQILNIPLVLQQDASFFWRGIKLGLYDSLISAYAFPNVDVQFQDCYQNMLSDDFVPASHYGFPMNPLSFNSSLLTGPPFILEPEIYCPPGGYILLFLQAPLINPVHTSFLNVSLYGVKRFKGCS